MVASFTYTAHPSRTVFGPGRVAELGAELDQLGINRALLLSTPEQAAMAEAVRGQLGGQAGGIYARATMHTPTDVTADALGHLREFGCDGLVALGGGSTIGLGKALALRTDLPQVAVPTTYAGSEMTPILGETENGQKNTQRTPKVLPETVIYDVELTLSLPPALSAASGVNALAHSVEALYARDANPIVSLMAEDSIRALGRSLPRVVAEPGDRAARGEAQYGAWLAGACLGAVGMALHHKICHVLGGTFDLRHGETHTVASTGRGIGGALATVRLNMEKGGLTDFEAKAETLAHGIAAIDGVVGAHLGVAAPDTTRVKTQETELRADMGEDIFDAVVLIDGVGRRELEAAMPQVLATLKGALPIASEQSAVYDLAYLLTAEDVA